MSKTNEERYRGELSMDIARNYLRKLLPPGGVVFTTIRYTSPAVCIHTVYCGNLSSMGYEACIKTADITEDVCKLLGAEYYHRASGCKGLRIARNRIAEEIAIRLYPDGFTCPGKAICQSPNHSDSDTEATATTSLIHRDGNHALRQFDF